MDFCLLFLGHDYFFEFIRFRIEVLYGNLSIKSLPLLLSNNFIWITGDEDDYMFIIFSISVILFQDIELSKEINESFKQSSQARTKLPSGIEMSVHVLTTGLVLDPFCLYLM